MKISRKKIVIGVIVLLVAAALVFANLKFKKQEGVAITVEDIKSRDLEAVVSASGMIQPKRSVNISADTMGRVTNLAVNEGDIVKRGQFLLQIDPKNLGAESRATARASRRHALLSRRPVRQCSPRANGCRSRTKT